ncbi:MAG: PspC domain-containing protein [Methanoregulaceae archaeon]|nr:PspC domain-containing protein [Methanoregulaceae archaeon]
MEKRLTRPKEGRMLGGVCAGMGKYFDVDVSIVRILWVVLTLLSIGIGIFAYIAAWILIPEEES